MTMKIEWVLRRNDWTIAAVSVVIFLLTILAGRIVMQADSRRNPAGFYGFTESYQLSRVRIGISGANLI